MSEDLKLSEARVAFESSLRKRHDVLGTIEAALQDWDDFHERYPEPFNSFWVAFQEGWSSRAELSAIKGGGEAVAWRWVEPGDEFNGYQQRIRISETRPSATQARLGVEPLFTHPPVVAEAEARAAHGWRQALHEAVSAIYLDDSSDYRSALFDVVRNLAPELVEELEANPSAVWHKTEAMLTAQPASGAVPDPMPILKRLFAAETRKQRETASTDYRMAAANDYYAALAELRALLAKGVV